MEGFLIRGRDLALPGWVSLYEPQVGVSTPYGALLCREATGVVPGLL